MPTTGATYIDTIFASSGTATQVPDAVQGDGSISFTQGYGPNYELAQGVPGSLNVELAEFNYLMNLITKILQTYQQQTVAPWITHAENGGSAFSYSKYAQVLYTDGHIYESLVNTNTTDPINDGVNWIIVDSSGVRIKLQANANFYIATTGSDSTGNGTSSAPWKTRQKAFNWVQQNIDFGSYSVTINCADGTYTDAFVSSGSLVGSSAGSNGLIFLGNTTTPGNCIINVPSSSLCFGNAMQGVQYVVKGFTLESSGTGSTGFSARNGSLINFQNIIFGPFANGDHIVAGDQSVISAIGPYAINNNATHHAVSYRQSSFYCTEQPVTLTGTPAFTAFLLVYDLSLAFVSSNTYSGSATGVRYSVSGNSVIDTNGGGANYFPGNSSGTTATGGVYL